MKIIKSPILFILVLALTSGFKANSQKLFDAIPEKIQFEKKLIEGVFNMNAGSAVDIRFSQTFRITGIIKSNQKIYDNLQTVVIESTNYNKAKLFISKTIDEDKSIKFVGRIISRASQDGFEIKTDVAGIGSLKKINLKEMIVE
jgi:hypothetical protein